MVSVEEAAKVILANLYKPEIIGLPLQDTSGYVLAEPVYADRDFPPFDRVTMDGIAVSYKQLMEGQREFEIAGIQPAGDPQKELTDEAKCLEVMTGAILPRGTDVVIRYEDITVSDNKAHVKLAAFEKFQNIHRQGRDVKKNAQILNPGCVLSPAEIALLASVGKSVVMVKQFPNVSIVSTGNELVPVDKTPGLHQIRGSNSFALHAAVRKISTSTTSYHLADDPVEMEPVLKKILDQSDVVILSGGVSKGKFDYVPKVLESLLVKKLFHQVSQRPGKPFWFGIKDDKAVFALPGNPVPTYMCFYKYIRPWILKSLGVALPQQTAILAADFKFNPELTYFLQVKIKIEYGKMVAYPNAGNGSGDFANLGEVDGFLQLPAEKSHFAAGEVFPYIPFRILE